MLAARILALKLPAINEVLDKAAMKERTRYEQSVDEALAKLTVLHVGVTQKWQSSKPLPYQLNTLCC